MARPSRFVLASALLVVAAAGCRRLPETIPYEATVSPEGSEPGVYRGKELVGAELRLDGKKVGILATPSTTVYANGTWSGPKSELRKNLAGPYTVALDGPCGRFDLPAEGPPIMWKSMTDREVAKIIANNKSFSIFLKVALPPLHSIYVDRGAATGELKIGPTVVPTDKKQLDLSLGGCKTSPTVTLDGAPIGVLDLRAKANLVTLEAGVCHVFAEVGYGNESATKPAKFFPAKAVVGLEEKPSYAIDPAPSTIKLYAGSKGTVTTELVRARCR